MVQSVAERKRPVGRRQPRVTVEVYPEDEELWHQARIAAAEDQTTLREVVLSAVREWLEARGRK